VGDHGVSFLVDDLATGHRLRARLVEFGERASALARRHGLRLHLGVSAATDAQALPARFQSALSAAEEALSRGLLLVHANPSRRRSAQRPLAESRRHLLSALSRGPGLLSPHFERYLQAVAIHCGYRMEPTRAHLEATLDQITDVLRASAALSEKSLDDLQHELDRAALQASTVDELAAAYRAVVADMELAMSRPNEARKERGIRHAIAFIREHFAEPLSVAQVARVAGFAAGYFSKVFVQNQQVTFQSYVRQLRLERAKHMLIATTFSAERVGRLCGFSSRTHFHRAFRQMCGMSPLEYRARSAVGFRKKLGTTARTRAAKRSMPTG
jgi:AraC-like DNA-binding protein